MLCSCAWVYVLESRGPGVWVLGPGRNDPLKSTGIVSEGSKMQVAGRSYRVRPVSTNTAQARGCVCPHFYSYRNFSHLHREAPNLTSQPPNGQEHQRNAQESSSMAREQRAELGGDSASSSCRARLPLPLCPSYRH